MNAVHGDVAMGVAQSITGDEGPQAPAGCCVQQQVILIAQAGAADAVGAHNGTDDQVLRGVRGQVCRAAEAHLSSAQGCGAKAPAVSCCRTAETCCGDA